MAPGLKEAFFNFIRELQSLEKNADVALPDPSWAGELKLTVDFTPSDYDGWTYNDLVHLYRAAKRAYKLQKLTHSALVGPSGSAEKSPLISSGKSQPPTQTQALPLTPPQLEIKKQEEQRVGQHLPAIKPALPKLSSLALPKPREKSKGEEPAVEPTFPPESAPAQPPKPSAEPSAHQFRSEEKALEPPASAPTALQIEPSEEELKEELAPKEEEFEEEISEPVPIEEVPGLKPEIKIPDFLKEDPLKAAQEDLVRRSLLNQQMDEQALRHQLVELTKKLFQERDPLKRKRIKEDLASIRTMLKKLKEHKPQPGVFSSLQRVQLEELKSARENVFRAWRRAVASILHNYLSLIKRSPKAKERLRVLFEEDLASIQRQTTDLVNVYRDFLSRKYSSEWHLLAKKAKIKNPAMYKNASLQRVVELLGSCQDLLISRAKALSALSDEALGIFADLLDKDVDGLIQEAEQAKLGSELIAKYRAGKLGREELAFHLRWLLKEKMVKELKKVAEVEEKAKEGKLKAVAPTYLTGGSATKEGVKESSAPSPSSGEGKEEQERHGEPEESKEVSEFMDLLKELEGDNA